MNPASESSASFCYARSGIVPVRSEDRDASEMQTQILLGETAKVRKITDRWLYIRCDFDGYEGWVNRNQMAFLTDEGYSDWLADERRAPSDAAGFRIVRSNDGLWVPPGASVVIRDERVLLPDGWYEIYGPRRPIRRENMLDTAAMLLGTPYLWGGRTDSGIDCSGFTQLAYFLHGSIIPRDSGKQFRAITPHTTDIREARRGDVVFFNTGGGPITHVGFYLGDGLLLHASGNVKYNIIDAGMRSSNMKFPFDRRLAEHIAGIHSGADLFEYGRKDYVYHVS